MPHCWRLLAWFGVIWGQAFAASWVPSADINRGRTTQLSQRLSTKLFAKQIADNPNNEQLYCLLNRFGFDQRRKTLCSYDLPVLAEVYLNGKSELCDIVELRPTKDPTVKVKLISGGDPRIVDIGQVTTVWESDLCLDPSINLPEQMQNQCNHFPVGYMETSLDGLYKSRVGRARSNSKKSLTKKQIGKLVSNISTEKDRLHADTILRQLVKSGTACSRLVDSKATAQVLYDNDNYNVLQQAVAARLLAQDAEAGGRFKRMPCTFVDKSAVTSEKGEETVNFFTIINGGWLVVDQSVRAGSEARKFAERVQSGKDDKPETGWTISDERIAQRLECLAMGEVFGSSTDASGLEVDVREALKALGAPATPEGARSVLVQIGRWSASEDERFGSQPWPPTVLEAARWYRQKRSTITREKALQDGYSDLTNIPFVCVDAKRTSFRDDAIGVRPRAGTGRKVTSASKWEILISIADVSDVFAELKGGDKTSADHLKALREAAASRGVSRYDLPLGPLHLLPPVVLQALAFSTVTMESNRAREKVQDYSRCVTVWVYIDDKSGKLLDAGIERSIIAPPVALSYQQATDLLDGKLNTSQHRRTGQVLGVVERSIASWSHQRRQNSAAAQKREDRLVLKEFVATQQSQHNERRNQRQRDDGHDGFQRTKGHKLVDTSLDLYGYVVAGLLRRSKAPFPQQAGSGQARGGRVATAPLRRYVDGMSQRQALSVLCAYGGPPLTKAECQGVSQEATDAYNAVSNIKSVKAPDAASKGLPNQKSAIRSLEMHLSGDKRRIVPAVGTGRANEVVIIGVGVRCQCKGVKGTLKPGQKILVQVHKIDADSGNVAVSQA